MDGKKFRAIDGNVDYSETNLNHVRKVSENDKKTCTFDHSNTVESYYFNEDTEQTQCIMKENAEVNKSHRRTETIPSKTKENSKSNGTKDKIRRVCPALVLTGVVLLFIFTALAVFIWKHNGKFHLRTVLAYFSSHSKIKRRKKKETIINLYSRV